jgi:hypothetical protein
MRYDYDDGKKSSGGWGGSGGDYKMEVMEKIVMRWYNNYDGEGD